MSAEVRIIKRYANRKLYDTTLSSYVTLEDLAALVRDGEDIQVVDNKTKEDLTAVTFAQIIFEQEKSRRRHMPLSALRSLIQGRIEIFQRLSQPVKELKEEAAKQVERLKRPAEVFDEKRNAVFDALDNIQQTIEETQRRVDERVREAVEGVSLVWHLRREIEELKVRLERLEEIEGIEPVVEVPDEAQQE